MGSGKQEDTLVSWSTNFSDTWGGQERAAPGHVGRVIGGAFGMALMAQVCICFACRGPLCPQTPSSLLDAAVFRPGVDSWCNMTRYHTAWAPATAHFGAQDTES